MKKGRKLVTIEELSLLTGKTYRTIRDRLAGLAPAKREGRRSFYDSADALPLIYATTSSEGAGVAELSHERAQLTRLQRRRLEVELEKRELGLIEELDFERFVESLFVTLRSRTMRMVRVVAPRVAPENPKNAEAVLEVECRELLDELASDETREEILGRGQASGDKSVARSSTAA